MRPEPRLPRRRRIALTSLIDVIFILLLFFLLSSTFTRYGEISLSTAGTAAGGTTEAAPLFLRLGSGDLSLNGAAHTLDTIGSALTDIAPEDGEARILVSVEDDVTSQRLVELLILLQPLDWAIVSVLG
jgi:biopolymer transport protein ExbD